ncbi:MAG: response regulator [Aphanothece sp. CMT-3BRIN-NPC111]|jgi:twitching motility two-component system response regulator PilG|nr:response regulator [Aphanothece sp. CMT-3BRIN-NPC111]
MQGTLNEIDIRSILQLIELGQRTGELFVEAYGFPPDSGRGDKSAAIDGKNPSSYQDVKSRQPGSFWFVFFINGQITYAADSQGNNLLRLRDYLRRYRADAALDSLSSLPSIASTNAPEYGYLWTLLENHVLTPAQVRNILQSMVHETLFDLLSLHQGSFIFEMGSALAPQLTTWEIAPLITKIMKQVQEWKQFHPHIQSPNQCPVLADAAKVRAALPQNAFKSLEAFVDGKTSLRQLGRYLNRDILTVARAIYPFVKQGWVQLLMTTAQEMPANKPEFQLRQAATVAQVVCIDDDVAIGKVVECILKQQSYKVTVITNPVQALSLVFQLKPDLILCDIAMPELDGYEICTMLRSSSTFRQTPIIMLTGMDGFIDRIRARMVGSTDYLTKPFGESELLMLIEKYIGSNNGLLFRSNSSLADALEREIKDTDITESASVQIVNDLIDTLVTSTDLR